MKKIICLIVLVLFLFSIGFAVEKKSKTETKKQLQSKETISETKGTIDKVDVKKGEIYIKQNGKTMKFKASKELCEKYMKKKGKKGVIKYTKLPDGSMLIKEILVK